MKLTKYYLILNDVTGLSYYIGNPFFNNQKKLAWSSQKQVNNFFQNGYPLIFKIKNDSAVVTTKYYLAPRTREEEPTFIDVSLWKTESPMNGCRFLHLPILNQNDIENWGWVIQNKGLKILYGHFNSQPTRFSAGIGGNNNFLTGPLNPLNPTRQLFSDVLKFELRSDGVLEFKNLITGELLYPYSYSSVLRPTQGNGTSQCSPKKYLGYWDNQNNLSIKVIGCEMYRDTCHKTDSNACISNPGLCDENDNNKCFTYFTFLPNSIQYGSQTLVIQYGLPEIMFIGHDNILVSNYLF
ncbi:hypothetical protein ACTFIU_001441 [Dictyostelium citrinum]